MLPRIAALLGVLAIAAAIILPTVVVPSQTRIPADLDSTTSLSGDLRSGVLADAFVSGDVENAFVGATTVTIEQHLQAVATDGDTVTLQDESVATLADGTVFANSTSEYTANAVNRLAPDGDPREGLVAGFPTGTEEKAYTFWSSTINAPFELAFVSTDDVNGLNTYRFEGGYEGDMTDEAVADTGLPTSLPKTVVASLLPLVDIAPFIKDQFTSRFDELPDDLTLGYSIVVNSTAWVEPNTGLVVDAARTETRTAKLLLGTLAVDAADVVDWTYEMTDEQVKENTDEASSLASKLQLGSTTGPIGLGIVGVGLLGAAVVLRRRDTSDDTES